MQLVYRDGTDGAEHFTFRARYAGLNAAGVSMATSETILNRWFWIMSRSAPDWTKIRRLDPPPPAPPR